MSNDAQHRDIAREVYKLRREERRVRGLYTKPWEELDLELQRHWCKIVERVIELYKPSQPESTDEGL